MDQSGKHIQGEGKRSEEEGPQRSMLMGDPCAWGSARVPPHLHTWPGPLTLSGSLDFNLTPKLISSAGVSVIRGASLVAQMVKNLCAVQEPQVRSLGWEDPLEKEMATHSSMLGWNIPWSVELAGYRLWVTESQT